MRIPYRTKPSAGFIYLLLVAVAQVAFLAWGLGRPALEEVWRMDIELGLGKRPPLSRREMNHLQTVLLDHPAVAGFLAEDKHAGVFSANDEGKVEGDYAYLIREGGDSAGVLTVSYVGARKKGAVAVSARTVDAEQQGTARRDQPFIWRLPDRPTPQLVELRFAPTDGKKESHPVRIDLRGAP